MAAIRWDSEIVGSVIGPLMGCEVLTAFFPETTFLGVMVFGWQRVAPWLHVTAAILVALGTAISGFWILAASPDGDQQLPRRNRRHSS
jgi:cytochrome d ubiquinol oxidase subunit I